MRTLCLSALFSTAIAVGLVGCASPRHQSADTWVQQARRDALPLSHLAGLAHAYPIVLLGEGHALVEPIQTLRLLLSPTNRAGWTHVVYEWPISDQPNLDQFMAGEDAVLQRLRQRYGQLPGATIDYFETFSFIRQGNRSCPEHVIKVCAADVPHPVRNYAEEERDYHMFNQIKRIVDADPRHRVLVYCGANHSMKSGLVEQTKRSGGTMLQSPLGALLRQRYHGRVVSIRVLEPTHDLVWQKLKDEAGLQSPVVIPTSSRWPTPVGLVSLYRWHPSLPSGGRSIKELYDLLVWWPASHDARREP